jgi:hypothetical protein
MSIACREHFPYWLKARSARGDPRAPGMRLAGRPSSCPQRVAGGVPGGTSQPTHRRAADPIPNLLHDAAL